MSIALLMMIKDEFKSTQKIIESLEDVGDEKVIVITGNNRVS